jgi:hypothetical protein
MLNVEELELRRRVADRLRRHLRAVIDGEEQGSPYLARMLLDAFTNGPQGEDRRDDGLRRLRTPNT